MPPLKLQVFFEKQDKKIKEESKKTLPLKPYEGRISVNEAREQKKSGEEQILIKTPKKEVLKKENTKEHLKMGDSSQNEDLKRTSLKPLSQEEKENLVQRTEEYRKNKRAFFQNKKVFNSFEQS